MDATIVSCRELVAAGSDLYASGMLAVLVDGPPGIAKTTLSSSIQHALGIQNRFMIKPGHHESIEFNGVPVADLGKMKAHLLRISSLLPDPELKGGCMLVGDEIGDADKSVQNLWCQLVLEGGFHNYLLPEGTIHYMTTNRVADRSGANRIVTKLGNRVAWFTLKPTVQEVFEYGISKGWNPIVLAFLKLKGPNPINPNDRADAEGYIPTYFNSFDTKDPAQMVKPIFASSRSIEFASNLMNYLDKHSPNISRGDLLTRVASLCGTPWATAFAPFRDEAMTMPDPDLILAGKKLPYPKLQSIMWTLTISLVHRCTKHNWKHVDAFLKQGPAEYRMLAVRQAFDNRAAQLIGPDFNATLQEEDIQQALKAK
jgi:hypothetical protein